MIVNTAGLARLGANLVCLGIPYTQINSETIETDEEHDEEVAELLDVMLNKDECPVCGTQVFEDETVCPECHTALGQEQGGDNE